MAESPQVMTSGARARSRASASSVCTPRFVESSSCHSSTTIVSSPAKTSWASSSDSMIERVSGVVTRAAGGIVRRRRRSVADVSPVRTPTFQRPGSHPPQRSASGASRARTVSAARALSGVSQTTRSPLVSPAAVASPTARARPSAPSQAASVLPVPVGACTRPLVPRAMSRQTARWKGNGFQPRVANHASGPVALLPPARFRAGWRVCRVVMPAPPDAASYRPSPCR